MIEFSGKTRTYNLAVARSTVLKHEIAVKKERFYLATSHNWLLLMGDVGKSSK